MLILVKFAPPVEPAEVDESDETAAGAEVDDAEGTAAGAAAVVDGEAGENGTRGGGGVKKKSEVKTGSFAAVGAPAMVPLGTYRGVIATFEPFNISPDGSGPEGWGESPGMATLYGPGCVVEMAYTGEPEGELSQAMVSVTDEEFAWPVLSRACKAGGWKLMDPESGRTFG